MGESDYYIVVDVPVAAATTPWNFFKGRRSPAPPFWSFRTYFINVDNFPESLRKDAVTELPHVGAATCVCVSARPTFSRPTCFLTVCQATPKQEELATQRRRRGRTGRFKCTDLCWPK